MKIPLYKPFVGKEEVGAATKVLQSGTLSRGKETKSFEEEFAKYVGKKFAIAVSNGTCGLHLSVRALGWKKDDEIITTPYSFISSANVLLYESIRPVFVDIDRKTFNLDISKIEKKITPKTKGLLLVDIWGMPIYSKELESFIKRYRLSVIEDACESIGNDTHVVGRIGNLTVYSFYENKQITTGGEGGIITTDDYSTAEICRSLRDQGRSDNSDWINHVRLGYNYRLTEMQAAIGREQLKKVSFIEDERVRMVELYKSLLQTISSIELPYEDDLNQRSWFLYYIVLPDKIIRDSLLKELKNKGVDAKSYFIPIYKFPEYQKFAYNEKDFPVCEDVYDRVLALPLFIGLKEEEIKYIARIIKDFLSK